MHAALLVGASLLLAADAPKPRDQEKIQGVWKILSEVENGTDAPPRRNVRVRFQFTADKFIITEGDDKRQGAYKLDPARRPSTIELVADDGPNKGKKALGIYQLSGDTLTLCLTLQEGKDPPGDFTARAGSGRVLLTLERDKD
jgi:uncharacterized protein (TIGR03067 family)